MALTIEVSPDALARVRLVYSPMWELLASLRLLVHARDSGRHGPWLTWAAPRFDGLDQADLLRALLPSATDYPDFLTPAPGPRPRSISGELRTVAEMDPDRTRTDLQAVSPGPLTAPLESLLSCPDPAGLLAATLRTYWEAVLAPVWPSVQQVLAADIAFRADDMAAGGLQQLLNGLHPRVSFTGDTLLVRSDACHGTRSAATVDQITLVPCAFGWPELLVSAAGEEPVCLSYGPRDAATLWEGEPDAVSQALVELLGRSRALILRMLDVPASAGQVAEHTGLSLPNVSQQLAILRGAGLVSARRSGRTVWSVRTELGSRLLASAADAAPTSARRGAVTHRPRAAG